MKDIELTAHSPATWFCILFLDYKFCVANKKYPACTALRQITLHASSYQLNMHDICMITVIIA